MDSVENLKRARMQKYSVQINYAAVATWPGDFRITISPPGGHSVSQFSSANWFLQHHRKSIPKSASTTQHSFTAIIQSYSGSESTAFISEIFDLARLICNPTDLTNSRDMTSRTESCGIKAAQAVRALALALPIT